MMAVILRGQGFPGQLLTKVGKYDDVEPRSVWLRAMPLAACELRSAVSACPLPVLRKNSVSKLTDTMGKPANQPFNLYMLPERSRP